MGQYAETVLSGVIDVDDANTSEHARNVTEGLHYYWNESQEASLLAWSSNRGVLPEATNVKHEWFEASDMPLWDVVATGAAAGATPQPVITNANYFQVDDIVEFPDVTPASATQSNQAIITAKSTTTLTLAPIGVGLTTVAAIPAGTRIFNYASTSAELSTSPGTKSVEHVNSYNYPIFLRINYGLGIFEKGSKHYTGDQLKTRREQARRRIKKAFNRTAIFGKRDTFTDATSGRPQYMAGGAREFIDANASENVLDWSAGLTERDLDEYLIEGPLRAGSPHRTWHCSSELFNEIHQLWKGKEQTNGPNTTEFGVNITRYLAPGGKTVDLINDENFTDAYEGFGMLIDHEAFKLVPFSEEGLFQYHPNMHDQDVAGVIHEFRIIGTFQVSRAEFLGYQHI